MQDINYFAEGSTSTGDIRWEPYLEKKIMEYIEQESILRNYVFDYPLPQNTFVVKIPRNYPTGAAVEVSEGSEIPRVRMPTDTLELSVVKYGTGGEMTDEAKETDWLGILGREQIDEAARRLLRKENNDIVNVMLTAPQTILPTTTSLTYEGIVDLKTKMIKLQTNPDVLFVAPDNYAQLEKDQQFLTASHFGDGTLFKEGVVGRVSGLDVVMVPEIPKDVALMMDTSLKPVWLVRREGVRIGRMRDEERQVDSFFLTMWEKPAVVRPQALGMITIN